VNVDALWQEGWIIAGHAIAAVIAFGFGTLQLAMPKGTSAHRGIGSFWIGLMAVVATSGFFIHELRVIGPFSPIHLLSILVLVSLFFAIRSAQSGNIHAHSSAMKSLYFLALILTGLFTLWPGRVMHTVIFGG